MSIVSTRLSRTPFSGSFLFSLVFFIVLGPTLFLSPQNVYALDITLAWDPNSEADLAGYRVFSRQEGESYNYNASTWEGDKTETSCTIYNLDNNTTYYFVARAFDTSNNESDDSNEVCHQPNHPPMLNAIGAKTADEGQLLEFTITASDPDGDNLTYSASNVPTGANFDAAAQTFSWTPEYGVAGNYTVTFTVTDNGTPIQSDSEEVAITVGVHVAPSLTGLSITGASSVNENSTDSYTATATFSDGSTQTVTESATWSENSLYASIDSNGVLTAAALLSNQIVTITASYTCADVTETAQKVVTIADVPDSNLAPLEPAITSPYYGQMECELLVDITTEPFSDPDSDLHGQSRWQISKQEDFFSPVIDVTSTEHLTIFPVPHTVLEPGTTYYVRVQFYDAHLEPSDWSDVIEFTTTSTFIDIDDNGIADDQEVAYGVDLNGDGISDSEQPEVIKCIQSDFGNATIGISKASDSITAIEAVQTIDPSTISDNTNKPKMFFLQLFSYRLRLTEPGVTATVRVYFSKDISKAGTFYKYDTISGWQDYSQHATFSEDGRSVILEVKDGGYGDSDGVANGFIVDPGGLAEASSSDVGTSEGTSSDRSGCFIATAAFGSYAEPHVKLLREFRDQCLLTNRPGRWFVRMYYRYGPFWADLINVHTWCKPIVRLALMPLVGISHVLIKASVVTRIIAGLSLSLFMLGCFLRMQGRSVMGRERT